MILKAYVKEMRGNRVFRNLDAFAPDTPRPTNQLYTIVQIQYIIRHYLESMNRPPFAFHSELQIHRLSSPVHQQLSAICAMTSLAVKAKRLFPGRIQPKETMSDAYLKSDHRKGFWVCWPQAVTKKTKDRPAIPVDVTRRLTGVAGVRRRLATFGVPFAEEVQLDVAVRG